MYRVTNSKGRYVDNQIKEKLDKLGELENDGKAK